MPVEPGIIDANVLVYALDADAPQHGPSRALLEAARDGSATLYVTLQILCEFYSAVTNRRRVPRPRSPADALAAISMLRAFLPILPVPKHAADELERLLRRHPVAGADIFDLQIVATMKVNGLHRIYTFNNQDFAPFPEIEATAP